MTTLALQPDASAGKDTYIQSDGPNAVKNYGAATSLLVGGQLFAYHGDRGLLQFDLSSIASTALISAAGMVLTDIGGSTNRASGTTDTAYMHRILVDWGEGNKNNATATAGDVSWECRAYPSAWSSPGCNGDGTDRVAAASSSAQLARSTSAAGLVTWGGLHPDVQDMVSGAVTNRGWLVVCPAKEQNDAYYDYRIFASSDYTTDTSLRPKLTIEYTAGSTSLAPLWDYYYRRRSA